MRAPKAGESEKELAAYSQDKYAVRFSSRTDALLVALLNANICPGDLVVIMLYFISAAGSIAGMGTTPVFVDIDNVTYNIDPGKWRK
ncbi:MAG: DegT/DnrJ/EryC1/StrS family aminotransferase [Desulfatiglandales bacterium]